MHRLFVLLPLLVVACSDDKDPIVCPSSPQCGVSLSSSPSDPSNAEDPSNASFSSTNDADTGTDSNPTSTSDATSATAPSDPTFATQTDPSDPSDPTASSPSDPSNVSFTDPSDPSNSDPSNSDPSNSDPSVDPSDSTSESDPSVGFIGESSGSSGGGDSDFGQCGWDEANKYYACAADGATPGLEDPEGIDPIACDGTPVEGDPCGTVSTIGCCTPNGTLFFCTEESTIFKQDCGA